MALGPVQLMGWLGLLPALGGVAVCALHLGRSRYVPLALGGFVIEACVLTFSRVATLMMARGSMGSRELGAAFAIASLLSLAGRSAVVVGLLGVLSELAALRRAPQPRP
jgi:hypothetical protein